MTCLIALTATRTDVFDMPSLVQRNGKLWQVAGKLTDDLACCRCAPAYCMDLAHSSDNFEETLESMTAHANDDSWLPGNPTCWKLAFSAVVIDDVQNDPASMVQRVEFCGDTIPADQSEAEVLAAFTAHFATIWPNFATGSQCTPSLTPCPMTVEAWRCIWNEGIPEIPACIGGSYFYPTYSITRECPPDCWED